MIKLYLTALLLLASSNANAQLANQAASLTSFVRNLDTSLRHINTVSTRTPGDKILCADGAFNYPSAKTVSYQKKKVTSLSEKDVQTLFKDMQNQSDIPFEFALAGCEQRAHEMARLLKLRGISPLKAFVSVDENDAPRLQIPHPQRSGDVIRWKYHVAPLVMVEKNGKQIPYIIDPSLTEKAVPLTEWRARMTAHNKNMKVQTRITDPRVFYNGMTVKYELDDDDFNVSNQGQLQHFKDLAEDPFGEEKYQEEVEGSFSTW